MLLVNESTTVLLGDVSEHF